MTASLPEDVVRALRSHECLPAGTSAADVGAGGGLPALGPRRRDHRPGDRWSTPAPRRDGPRPAQRSASSATARTGARAPHRLLGRFHVTGVFWYRFPYWGFARLPAWTDRSSVAALHRVLLDRARAASATRSRRTSSRCSVPPACSERWRRAFAPCRPSPGAWPSAIATSPPPSGSTPPSKAKRTGARDRRRPRRGARHRPHRPVGERGAVRRRATPSGASTSCARRRSIRARRSSCDEICSRARGGRLRDPLRRRRPGARPRAGEGAARGRHRGAPGRSAARPAVGRIEVQVFGRPLPLPIGPAALARAAGVPIVPVFNFRDGRFRAAQRWRGRSIQVARTADRDRDVATAVAAPRRGDRVGDPAIARTSGSASGRLWS